MKGVKRILTNYGLRIRLITIVTALTVVLVFLIGVVVLKIAEHNIMKQKILAGDLALKSVQSVLDTFWYGRRELIRTPDDIDKLNRFAQDMARNLNLIEFELVDTHVRVIAAHEPERLGVVADSTQVRDTLATERSHRNFVGDQGAFGFGLYDEMEYTGPLFLDDHIVAVARFSMPLTDVTSSLAGTLTMLYLYTFFDVLLVLIIGAFLLMYFVIRPLNDLRRATERIIQGDLDHPIPQRANDEIGLLSGALDELRSTLAEKEATVKMQMESLGSLNRQLTRIRDQLIHTDRLSYLGRVTAGVAHEIGNPLGSIYGYIDILRSSADDPKLYQDILNRMGDEVGRIDSIMKELLNFSRPQHEKRTPIALAELMDQCLDILRTQRVLDRVSVEVQADPNTPPILAETGQLKQVFLNLMINAVDAMEGQGRAQISISFGRYESLQALAPLLGEEPDVESGKIAYTDLDKRGIFFSSRIPYTEGERIVMVSIRDFGPGIDPKQHASIFEPFFTTKGKSRGTGLGLSICQRIVEGIGGVMRVQSRPGEGSVFTCFFLPDHDDSATGEDGE